MRKCIHVILLGCCSLAMYQAKACDLDFPDLTESHTQMKKLGNASLSVLFWDIYKSTLYTSEAEKPSSASKVLFEIQYQREIGSQDLVEQTMAQWQHLKLSPAEYKNYLPELRSIWPSVKKGDTLALLVSNNSSSFYLNQSCIGTINDPHFGKRFLDIWLSPNTSEPKLRKRLLGERG
ncbi:hypothetical protein D5018_00425 [Parashewanella curva]|uniref:Chalcone isomerase domain-containing protein n=1 Tax=Parashewanella curva TaxID=2338552 RepID=A0A3L8Q384_9GAMM|nr:chalcone isomerase family protein [Parashewanella curva]RLV61618.1 hypothetical protein D5018_00425 [Parashewanella curva]